MWKFLYHMRERRHAAHSSTPFPTRQLFVLALCRICEPIAFMSIFPYAYYMIASFNITEDRERISAYAGLLITSFTFAEFSTGILWGKISDRIGRKSTLIMGLAGTAISILCFGFARNLPTALLARALGGLLNGNVGVLQTTVAELVTVKEHQPRAYSIMPFVWCLGSIIGPAMGGALAQPCKAYPRLFSTGSVFEKFPFLLPNLVCFVILLFGIANGVLFLEETHPELKGRRDRGVEMGDWIVAKWFGGENSNSLEEKMRASITPSLLEDDAPPAYQTRENSPRTSLAAHSSESRGDVESNTSQQRVGCTTIFTKDVILIIVAYGILAYHSVSFDMLMPVFLSQPSSSLLPRLPFFFSGGFELPTHTIGFMLAVQGVYSMFAQLWLFPWAVKRMGTLNIFRSIMLVWPLLYLIVPYTVLLPVRIQMPAIYFCLLTKITFHVIAFPSIAILLNNAVPSRLVLGTVNGVAASTASLNRAFGPAVTGAVNGFGLNIGCIGLAWWINGMVCVIGAFESFSMTEAETETTDAHCEKEEEQQTSCEPLLHSANIDQQGDNLSLPYESRVVGHVEIHFDDKY